MVITEGLLMFYLGEYLSTRDPHTVSVATALEALEERNEVRGKDMEIAMMMILSTLRIRSYRGNRNNCPKISPGRRKNGSLHADTAQKCKMDREIRATAAEMISELNLGEPEHLRQANVQQDSDKVLSEAMRKFLGTGEKQMPASRANDRVWLYITQNELDDDFVVKCDWKLERLFGRSSFTKDDIPSLVEEHMSMPIPE